MSPSLVTLDLSDDVDFSAPTATATTPNRTLLLAPPSVAAHEEKLHKVFSTHDRSSCDLQMLDRLAGGLVKLASDTYDKILILTDASDATASALELLDRKVLATLVPAMRVGGVLRTEDERVAFGPREEKEAILAGLVKKEGGVFEKADEEEAVAVPLKFGAKKKTAAPAPVVVDLDDGDDDDIIDEDTLLTDADLKRPIVQRKSFSVPRHSNIIRSDGLTNKKSPRVPAQAGKEETSLQGLHLRSRRAAQAGGRPEARAGRQGPRCAQAQRR